MEKHTRDITMDPVVVIGVVVLASVLAYIVWKIISKPHAPSAPPTSAPALPPTGGGEAKSYNCLPMANCYVAGAGGIPKSYNLCPIDGGCKGTFTTPADCADLCNAQPECNIWQYSGADNSCYTFKGAVDNPPQCPTTKPKQVAGFNAKTIKPPEGAVKGPCHVPGQAPTQPPTRSPTGAPAMPPSGAPSRPPTVPPPSSLGACPLATACASMDAGRTLADGMGTEGGWTMLTAENKDEISFWTLDPSQIADGGSGYLSCGCGYTTFNAALPGGSTPGASFQAPEAPGLPHGIRIWGSADFAPCKENCPWVASKNAFHFGTNPGQVYTLDFNVKTYGTASKWFAVWLDPICWGGQLPNAGAGMTEIDQVENMGEVRIDFNTCNFDNPGTELGKSPLIPQSKLDSTHNQAEAGVCDQVLYQIWCPTTDDLSSAPMTGDQLDHHVTVQFDPVPGDPTYGGVKGQFPQNGKVLVTVCDRAATSRTAWNSCSCTPPGDMVGGKVSKNIQTTGPGGWADNAYKLVVDIWGNDAPEFNGVLEVTGVRILDSQGNQVHGMPVGQGGSAVPTTKQGTPRGADEPACSAFYRKYLHTGPPTAPPPGIGGCANPFVLKNTNYNETTNLTNPPMKKAVTTPEECCIYCTETKGCGVGIMNAGDCWLHSTVTDADLAACVPAGTQCTAVFPSGSKGPTKS